MPWFLLIISVLSGFALGFAVCNQLYTKKIAELIKYTPESELAENRLKIFKEGWNAANSNVENVKMQYDKLVNPIKYAPEQE